jgi:uncharacterized membrane protein
MSAGGTILLAGLGGAAGVLAADVVADAFYIRGDRVTAGAIGGAVGAVIATFIGVTVTKVDEKSSTGLSGAPLQMLGFP